MAPFVREQIDYYEAGPVLPTVRASVAARGIAMVESRGRGRGRGSGRGRGRGKGSFIILTSCNPTLVCR